MNYLSALPQPFSKARVFFHIRFTPIILLLAGYGPNPSVFRDVNFPSVLSRRHRQHAISFTIFVHSKLFDAYYTISYPCATENRNEIRQTAVVKYKRQRTVYCLNLTRNIHLGDKTAYRCQHRVCTMEEGMCFWVFDYKKFQINYEARFHWTFWTEQLFFILLSSWQFWKGPMC